jgi:hypothetical protein
MEDGDKIEAALYEHWTACINIDVKGQVRLFLPFFLGFQSNIDFLSFLF